MNKVFCHLVISLSSRAASSDHRLMGITFLKAKEKSAVNYLLAFNSKILQLLIQGRALIEQTIITFFFRTLVFYPPGTNSYNTENNMDSIMEVNSRKKIVQI